MIFNEEISTTSTYNTHSNVSCLLVSDKGKDKEQLLSELGNIDAGNWASNRLNEMIILAKNEKLPPDCTKKGNRALTVLKPVNLNISDKMTTIIGSDISLLRNG